MKKPVSNLLNSRFDRRPDTQRMRQIMAYARMSASYACDDSTLVAAFQRPRLTPIY
jgi:hypothetical protein